MMAGAGSVDFDLTDFPVAPADLRALALENRSEFGCKSLIYCDLRVTAARPRRIAYEAEPPLAGDCFLSAQERPILEDRRMLSLPFRSSRTATGMALALAALAIAACSDAPTDPSSAARMQQHSAALASVSAASSNSSQYLACPSSHTLSASKVIGPRGGILAVDGSALAIPPGAVPVPTRFTFIVPESDIMQIEAHADGVEHYVFQRPVLITIDYSRCAQSVESLPSFSAWYIDTGTRNPLSWMGGVDDRRSHRLFFSTEHLSGYAVSERSGNAAGNGLN
jgi:hypothetical protein